MFKPFSLIFFVAVMVWMGSIFLTSDPQLRIERTCSPVEAGRRAAAGAMGLIDVSWGDATNEFFENMHYGCRYVIWQVFFEEDWSKSQEENATRHRQENTQEQRKNRIGTK